MTTQPPPNPDDQPSPWEPPRDDPGAARIDQPDPYNRGGLAPQHPSMYAPPVNVYTNTPSASNGVATAGGVCGIVAAAISWIPIVNFFALVLSIIAVALGGVGLSRANRLAREGRGPVGRGMAITGIVIGAIGLLIAVLVIAALGSAVQQINNTPTP